jgi:hypothetical protein
MPAKNGVRLNNTSQTEQTWPEPRQQRQHRSVAATHSQTLGCTSQGNIELMSKEEVLDFKPAVRLE